MPTFATDLRLDAVIAPLCRGTTAGQRMARLLGRLRDPDAVAFRHEVFHDPETPTLRDVPASASGS
jgi:hypothetical protein